MAVASPSTHWCASRIVKEFSYVWEIRKFENLCASKESCIKSPTFTTTNDSLTWMLKLYPKGPTDEVLRADCPAGDGASAVQETKDMTIYLALEENCSADNPIVRAKFQISVIRDGHNYRPSGYDEYLDFVPGKSWRIVWRKELFDQEGYLREDGSLVIRCDISLMLSESKNPVSGMTALFQSTQRPFIVDVMRKMFNDELFTDVLLSVQGNDFPAHRAVLSAQSPVFRGMFDQSKESAHNRVLVSDTEPAVLRALLNFVYTDKVPENLPELAEGLLTASHKYQLFRLKGVCEAVMAQYISEETAAYYLILAHLNDSKPLKQVSVHFICQHANPVMQSAGWSCLKDYPELLAELCHKLAHAEKSKSKRSSKILSSI